MEDAGYEEIRDPMQIVRFLRKAIEEEVNVEVALNDRTRLYFTFFLDHLPEALTDAAATSPSPDAPPAPPPSPDPSAKSKGKEYGKGKEKEKSKEKGKEKGAEEEPSTPPPRYPFYETCSYLKNRDHLLIAPLNPSMGNALIRGCQNVEFRFFQGVKAIEGVTAFDQAITVRGEPVIQLKFPAMVRVFRKRRHFRAKLTPDVELKLTVVRTGQAPLRTGLIDISVGGLAFCNPLTADDFPQGQAVRILIETPDLPTMTLDGLVRNHARATLKEGCKKGEGRIGVQFDILSATVAMRIEELVSYVQRKHLQVVLDRKKESASLMNRHPEEEKDEKDEKDEKNEKNEKEEKKGGLAEELGRFLQVKKRFSFS
ncbi:MAG: PilZ domain-containing protein [Magnetococcales bacterium]|nr:PilZ domain-containing protein [Magnetococcales bacterium]